MNYSFHPHAEKELEEIETHYDSLSEGLGNQFRDDVELTISRILKFPNAWQALSPIVRRCRLTGFPYGIVYQIMPREIQLLAVMHNRRKPNYWTYRI
jgi:plasmid stabilization system protein ParE